MNHYQDKVEDHVRTVPANAYSAKPNSYYRTRSASTPGKYAVKGGVVPREYPEVRGPGEHRGDYLQDSGGGYAPDSADSTDADMMYDSQVR